MSSIDPFVAGGSVLSFRLLERVGASVWRAEDTRSGKTVAIKVLTKQLPRDPARREAVIRDIRLGAALYHASLVTIIEIAPADDALIMVMEWFESLPVAVAYRGRAADRTEFFRVIYQLADAVKLLQARNVLHLNIAGDSVLVAANGQVKLAGLNATTFLPRREGQGSAFSQKGNDGNAVSYMAPEQIANQPVTTQTDVFSMGIVMYEVATGRRPYLAPSAAEIARKIVDEQPPSPKAVNPAIDGAVLNVMGKCFFKDAYRRHKDAKAICDDIVKVDGEVVAWANEIARAALNAVATARHAAQARQSVLLVAEIADHDATNAVDPVGAGKAAARMQQILGEAIYLFDGQVIDPFGPRFVGELSSIENGLEAGRKGEFDFSAGQQDGDEIPVRLLLHFGDVETRDGSPAGPTVEKAFEILKQIEPGKLYITEAFVKKGKVAVRLRDAGARAGVKLFAIAPDGEAAEQAARAAAEAEEAARLAAQGEAEVTAANAVRARKTNRTRFAAAAAAAVVIIGGASGFLWMQNRKREYAPVVVTPRAGLAPATVATPRNVAVQPFTIEPADPTLQQRGEAIRLATTEILRSFPEVRVVDTTGTDGSAYSAKLTGGAAAPQIVPITGGNKPMTGQASALIDASSGIQSLVSWIANDLKIQPRNAASADAYNAFADAVAANAAKDDARTEASLRNAIKADSRFLPAEVMAFRFFDSKGNDTDALAAAKQVVALDPSNVDAARRVARASLASGDLPSAFNGYAAVLKRDPSDAEALNMLGRYALAAGDTPHFTAAITRLGVSDATAVHAPDTLVASGRIDSAAERYYDVEQRMPRNASLALKIGRIAVLRHSTEIADVELKKLEQFDPKYSAHILKAYLAAQSGNKAAAASELKAAEAASKPGDEYWTSVAEIAAMSGDARGVNDALDRAAARKEPTASYVLANPLFGFLQSDARFLKIREKLVAQQNEIRTALAGVTM
jgi:tetratricopeptide (TPR) repeat protein